MLNKACFCIVKSILNKYLSIRQTERKREAETMVIGRIL